MLVDAYDSFTHNLLHGLGVAGADVQVVHCDRVTADEVFALDPARIVLGPGPGRPEDAGCFLDVAHRAAASRVPLLGVCLGHQCIADRGGMTVARHNVIMHGKTSEVSHDNKGVFEGLSQPFVATRYHSLVVTRSTIPTTPDANGDGWEVSATCTDPEGGAEVVMGLRRVWADASKAPLEGVQFHPESFLTTEGPVLLWNFLRMGARGRDVAKPAIEPLSV